MAAFNFNFNSFRFRLGCSAMFFSLLLCSALLRFLFGWVRQRRHSNWFESNGNVEWNCGQQFLCFSSTVSAYCVIIKASEKLFKRFVLPFVNGWIVNASVSIVAAQTSVAVLGSIVWWLKIIQADCYWYLGDLCHTAQHTSTPMAEASQSILGFNVKWSCWNWLENTTDQINESVSEQERERERSKAKMVYGISTHCFVLCTRATPAMADHVQLQMQTNWYATERPNIRISQTHANPNTLNCLAAKRCASSFNVTPCIPITNRQRFSGQMDEKLNCNHAVNNNSRWAKTIRMT